MDSDQSINPQSGLSDSGEIRNSKLRILVSAGPTREYFDSVRFISNGSTGRQGFAIAAAAARRGHQVVLVSGPVEEAVRRTIDALYIPSQPVPSTLPPGNPGANVGVGRGDIRLLPVITAAEMAEVCKREFEHCDLAIMTAAVCDYRATSTALHKLSKSDQPMSVTLEPTEDICAALGKIKDRRRVIGFAMDDQDGMAKAEFKLKRKCCDAMIHNGPDNVGADRATVRMLLADGGWQPPVSGSKAEIADWLIQFLEQHPTMQ